MAPGKVRRIEFEYIRHGTKSFIVSFAVAIGRVDTISCGDTRNEEDFVSHIKGVVESSLSTSRWHVVADNLNNDLKDKVLAFVEYFNLTMAKPFKWTYRGSALTA